VNRGLRQLWRSCIDQGMSHGPLEQYERSSPIIAVVRERGLSSVIVRTSRSASFHHSLFDRSIVHVRGVAVYTRAQPRGELPEPIRVRRIRPRDVARAGTGPHVRVAVLQLPYLGIGSASCKTPDRTGCGFRIGKTETWYRHVLPC